MIAAHLPILQVVVPLLAAPVSVLLRGPRVAWSFALLVTWTSFAISLWLLILVLDQGVISYELGGFAPPWGIEYRIDAANAFVLLIVTAIGAAVVPYARDSIEKELTRRSIPLFYTMYLLCFAGLLGITATGDAFNLFVFLEISSLSTYVLIAMGARVTKRALTAAYTYLIMGTIGATFFVIGVGLLYMVTGSLNMVDVASRIGDLGGNRTVQAAFAFITIGLGLKLALFPLHLWLPNAYTYAPSAVTAFLAATATKVAVYAMLRFLFTVFGFNFAFELLSLEVLFLPLALIGMFAASTVAIFQVDIKRMLAYSSVAQIGYMILGLSFASVAGLTATLIHLFNHALMKGGLFMALGAVAYRVGAVTIRDFRGLSRDMPWTMAAFVGGGLSLIGVPLTVGFISKWYLVLAALERGWWPVAILIVLASMLAVIYVWRVIEAAYLQPPVEGRRIREAPASLLVPTWILIGASVLFGISADFTAGVAETAADALFADALNFDPSAEPDTAVVPEDRVLP